MQLPIRTKIAGMRHGKRMQNAKYTNWGSKFILEREPDNAHDPNAIKVCIPVRKGRHRLGLGYIPASIAVDLAPLMDAGQQFKANFSYKIVDDNGITKGLLIKISEKEKKENDNH